LKQKHLHIIPLVFLAVILFPLASIVFLEGAQWYLKSTADERIKNHKTETITRQAASVQWEKLGKELVVDGRMFDVAYYTISNGFLTAKGFFDEGESGIRELLMSIQKNKKRHPLHQALFMLQCFAACVTLSYSFYAYPAIVSYHTIFSKLLPYPSYLVLRRPPRSCTSR
jgi:hypothetical protein